MGTSNGYVSGLVKVHDAGPPADRFNLVIVAEGYRASEIAQFQADVDDFVGYLFSVPPFDEDAIACALNIYRLEVVSDESGADKPNCDDGDVPGGPVTVDTYFDATFCADGEITRLMSGDSALAQTTVEDYLPEWTQILVLVNDTQRGGAGGSVAWSTRGGFDWRDVIVHEMGHSAFGLADEYDYYAGGDEEGQDNHPGPEPMQPNVTIEPDPTLVKWSTLVTAGGAAPTMDNSDCSSPNNDPSPVSVGIVGTFEGAHYYHCDAYRPQYRCKMRVTTDDFCAVCQQVVRDTMAGYAAPAGAGAITLDTPSVAFEDIPEGTSTVRPVTFSVDTCLPVTFEVTSAPAAPFSVAFEPLVVSNPGPGSVRLARVWIRYDCESDTAAHMSSVTIRLVETAETWTVPLSANCVPRETAAVQLVFDRSASMLDMTSEGRQKSEVLKDSARVMADVAYTDTGLGANTYDHDAQPLMDIQVAGAVMGGAGRQALRNAINSYAPNPAGNTATGDGIEFAKTKLDDATGYDNHAMIVLTDGKDTASKSVDEVADGVINQTVFAIGLGTAEQIDPRTLETLAGATGGYMLMTGLLTTDDTFLLEKFYLQILAGMTNNDIILDPEGYLSFAAPEARIPFDVAEADIEISVITLATLTQVVEMALEAPDGTIFGTAEFIADASIDYAVSTDSILARAALPLVSDGQPLREGRWHLLLRLDVERLRKLLSGLPDQVGDNLESSPQYQAFLRLIEDLHEHGVKYSATVQTYSNLRMEVQLTQSSHEPGATLSLAAAITEYGGPFRGSASVSVDVTRPDDTLIKYALVHEGDGHYSTDVPAPIAGTYTLRVRASGTTHRGRPFTREQLRTASVWAGGDRPKDPSGGGRPGDGDGDGKPGDGGIFDILCCLYRNDGLRGQFWEEMVRLGIDPDVLRRCLERLCKARETTPTPTSTGSLSAVQIRDIEVQLERSKAAVLAALRG